MSARPIDVHREILRWSPSQPGWQRDALRRLVTKGSLTAADIEELTSLCKAAHGLADGETNEGHPLEQQHLPVRTDDSAAVSLISLTHLRGVNALAPQQTVEFGSGLTIVYGPNAAGKSGYTRILKRACRARGAEEILGNVFNQAAPGRPSATIRFRVGHKERNFAWSDQEDSSEDLGQVSVFDTHCASVYLKEHTDVAFRPLGLDLFDSLSDTCERVRKVLELEQRELENNYPKLPELTEGTAAYKLVSNLTSLTKPEDVERLATLSDPERERLIQIRKQIQDLSGREPKKVAQTLQLRTRSLQALADHLDKVSSLIGDEGIEAIFRAHRTLREAKGAAENLRTQTFLPQLLAGSGSDTWRALWEAARRYSTDEAYPGLAFPVTEDEARCLLCQQDLAKEAAERFRQFEAFVQSNLQQEVDRAASTLRKLRSALELLDVSDDTTLNRLGELRIEEETLAAQIESAFKRAAERQEKAMTALRKDGEVPKNLPPYDNLASQVRKEVRSLQERGNSLLKEEGSATRIGELSGELRELEAREKLGRMLDAVLQEIERKKKLAAYSVCLRDTNTRSITLKSTDVTKRAVTEQLASAFREELQRIGFTHLEIALEPARGVRGALYHRLVLRRAPSADIPRVVSEGEARAVALASFFAELAPATQRSAILFDDPVSSLDHSWRENVARRLATAARRRQVIVFTHDIVFVLALTGEAERAGAELCHQYIRNEAAGAGVLSPELPWVAMKVKGRIGVLRSKVQAAGKLHHTASRGDYEREAVLIYGMLREAWERGLEEVLLGGVVERYRPSIQTQQVGQLADITEEDCRILFEAMAKCSRWLPGHDQAPAENVSVPGPDDLGADVETLAEWVSRIHKRR